MITYPLPQSTKYKLPHVDDYVLDNLAQSVVHEPQILRSATIVSSTQSFAESWINKTESLGLYYYISHSLHSLLKSPSMLANRLFVIAGDFPEGTTDSIQKIISHRVTYPSFFYAGSLSYCNRNMDHFDSLRIKLDLTLRIRKVTDSFLNDDGKQRNQGFSHSNRTYHGETSPQRLVLKNDIVLNLKQRLTEAPDVFLESAITGIRSSKRST